MIPFEAFSDLPVMSMKAALRAPLKAWLSALLTNCWHTHACTRTHTHTHTHTHTRVCETTHLLHTDHFYVKNTLEETGCVPDQTKENLSEIK